MKSAVVAEPAIGGYAVGPGSRENTKMADVTPELMFEVLKSVQARLAQVDGKVDELRQGVQALGTSQNGIRQEITGIHEEILGIHATLIRHEGRLDRIDRRLELSDAPAR
jgi:septal ring factor EnvC (AmiA/AmiB activator)